MSEPQARRARLVRAAALAGMAVLYLAMAPYAVLHLDIARDLLIGLRIARGDEFPLLGPLLASTVKLGPAWYYLLALLIGTTGSVYGTFVMIAVLGALQFPLAYLAGKSLHSRAAGMLWALLLLLPSWSAFEQVFPMHAQLTAALVLACVVCMVRIARGGRPRYWYGLALAFSLALHAHPSTFGIGAIGLALVAWGLWRGALRWGTLAGAGALALLPFAPFLVQQATGGFDLFRAAGGYLADTQRTGSLSAALPLAWQTTVGGLDYWLRSIGRLEPALVGVAVALAAVVQLLGLSAWLARALRPREHRSWALEAAAVVTVLLATALIRAEHPYYMTTTLRVLLAGAIAIGLARLHATAAGRWLTPALAVVVLGLNLGVTAIFARAQTHGSMPVAFFPLLDVGRAAEATTDMLLMPAYVLPRSGAFVCGAARPALHGALAERMVHGYAIEARLACGSPDVVAGGADSDREHWLGLSRGLARAAGVSPQASLGPVHLFRVRRVIGEPPPFVPPDKPVYPPMPARYGDSARVRLQAELAPGEHLAIANIGFAMSADPAIVVRIDGLESPPVARDMVAAVYACAGCTADSPGRVEIEVEAVDPDRVDIVVF